YAEPSPWQDAQPEVTSQGGVSLAQWREGGTRYALVGEMPESSLQTLAQAASNDAASGANMLADAQHQQTMPANGDDHGAGTRQSLPVTDDVVSIGTGSDYAARPNRM